MSTNHLLSWPIILGETRGAGIPELPRSVLTGGVPFRHDSMPAEVAMLLPTSQGPAGVIDALIQQPAICEHAMPGLFLASPFLNLNLECKRLLAAGVCWITNLPSVEQQDFEFSRQLTDVGLDFTRELERLAEFRSAGFKVAVVVATAEAAELTVPVNPEIIIVFPRIGDFAAGFPSLRQRGTAAQNVADVMRTAGWKGILLGLGDTREAENERLWPPCLDGIVCRPEPIGDSPGSN